MQKNEIITCINCPMGCRMEVTLEDGAVVSVKGNTCKRGDLYAHQECTQPLRMITAVARSGMAAAMPAQKSPTPMRRLMVNMVLMKKPPPGPGARNPLYRLSGRQWY